ncbi:MAG: adenylate/guanylate cyclase domain-containing protein [Phormidesmis sp. RL_2_1]|nr:adenylate/guanylate cyclase domain-containing protein [Phormidesmis sp. RL_2_1]
MNTPVHPQIQRTLAAIVVTDAVGFSKHMSQDEEKALTMINRDLKLIAEMCEFFEGKVLKTVGDGVLMYFVSAVQAAACAVEMQKTFAGFIQAGQADEHFVHRVGVHLGDIFFNQQDMMGTGVNIAARLESAAKPGAVCMSQVVYDVVKSRLELDAIYAGKLSLKNIEETVAAYHVWSLGTCPPESSEGIAEEGHTGELTGESTEAVAPLSMTPLNAALKALSEHPNSRRIKKLLYGTHQARWENNAAVLEGISLKLLLESLTDRNINMDECRHSLYQIVGTLNRQAEYRQVAEAILESLIPFYGDTGGTVRSPHSAHVATVTMDEPPNVLLHDPHDLVSEGSIDLLQAPTAALYQDIADRLDQASEIIRIKKMLYCLCYDKWENDNHRIAKLKTLELIETMLCQNFATIQDLQDRLRIILLRLNRKAKYAPIANVIFQECQVLYPEANSQISLPGTSELQDSLDENTQINVRKQPDKPWLVMQDSTGQSTAAPAAIAKMIQTAQIR